MTISRAPHQHRVSLTLAALAGAALTALPAAGATAAPAAPSGCSDVLVITARGTGEPADGGGLNALVSAVRGGTSQSVAAYSLLYPATLDFFNSVAQGVTLLRAKATESTRDCPQQRLVLAGYSQGAWVVGDALAGTGLGSAGSRVAAVVLFGDPRFNGSESFDAGSFSSATNGVIPRAGGELARYASRTRSYCDTGDSVCQYGTSGDAHTGYGAHRTGAAAKFVLGRLGSSAAGPDAAAPDTGPDGGTATDAAAQPPSWLALAQWLWSLLT